jgi:hypothetical protein
MFCNEIDTNLLLLLKEFLTEASRENPMILPNSAAGISLICTENCLEASISKTAPPEHLVSHGPFGSIYIAIQPFGQVIEQLGCPGAVHVFITFSPVIAEQNG